MDEADIEVINRGRVASIIHGDINDYIEKEKNKIVEMLVTSLRDKSLTTESIWASIGGLKSLKDLQTAIASDINRGRDRAKKVDG